MTRQTFHRLCLTLFTLLTLAGAPPARAADWPMDRGNPQRTGVAEGSLPAKLELLWKFKFGGEFEGGAAIVDGWVYAGSNSGKVACLDLKTGAPRWQASLASGILTSPLVWQGRVYFVDGTGGVLCQDTATTRTIWKFEADAEIHSSPAIEQGRLLFGSYDQNLYCLDPMTGKVNWKFETQGPVHCSPAIGGGKAFVAGCDHILRGVWVTSSSLAPTTTSMAWSLEMENYSASSPAIFGGMLYVGHFGGKVIAVDVKTGKQKWEYAPPESSDFPFFASCAVNWSRVVAGGRDRKVHCLERETGKRVWVFETKGDIDGSPVIAGETVYVPSKDGTLYGLEMKSGKKIWEYVAGVPLASSVAVGEGKLVVGDSEGTLYCFGVK